ncbi:von Willebrand factor A domain-containing protein 2 [Sceloporus undulatus]|uniref:von Willebrand factor A domain-containing protein 2 n=1 Tax=Sceloporus undulatus TaxID=8520 RepID=UPI001C4D5C58|nr:von Willebrand factor A domain-containing protein 2 [Sceloporus undulatus]
MSIVHVGWPRKRRSFHISISLCLFPRRSTAPEDLQGEPANQKQHFPFFSSSSPAMSLLLLLESTCIFLFSQALMSQSTQELHVSQETIEKISAAGQLMNCSAPVDVMFLLDGSYSIGKGNFERSKYLIIKLCDALDIGREKVRVGAIQFSNAAYLEFSLDAYFTKQEIKDKLKRIVFKGGRTETGLALKYILRKGFRGGRNSLVPKLLIILTDGKSQGNVAAPAKQLKERGIAVFAVGISFPRWEELHILASEPTECYLLFAEDTDDASNGLYTTLTGSAICNAAFPGCTAEYHPCERRTVKRVKELVGNYLCWKGTKSNSAVQTSLCPFYKYSRLVHLEIGFGRWVEITSKMDSPRTNIIAPSSFLSYSCFVFPDPCSSHPCQNGGTCIQQGLEGYHCVCPAGFGGDANCTPKLSLECSVDLLFLVDSSSSTTLEGFLRYKAFLKRFLQAVWSAETSGNMGVAHYSDDVEMTVRVGDYKDLLSLVKAIDSMLFSGGSTLTGKALRHVTQHGFKSAPVFADVPDDLPRVVILLTDANAQDSVVEAAKYSRGQDVFLIGIGSEFLRAELEEITGNPKRTIIYSTPQDLFNKITELQRKICSIDSQGCPTQSLDLVFALDSSGSVGRDNFVQLKTFVSSMSSQFVINRDVTQIGLVVFGKRSQTIFGLDRHVTDSSLHEAINQASFVGGSVSVGSSLLHIYDDVLTVQKGARPGVKKIVVVITGGAGLEDAIVPAQQLRNNDISLFIVGMGHIPTGSLLKIAGSYDNVLRISSYKDLKYNEGLIMERICDEAKKPVNLCRPNPCMNDGMCVPGNGSYHCQCQGWEGPHCENRIQRGNASQSQRHPATVRDLRNQHGWRQLYRTQQRSKRQMMPTQ